MIQIMAAPLSSNATFWWIMQCQPSLRWTHLNKCRFEIYWKMRPTCQSDTQLNANALYFEAAASQKCSRDSYTETKNVFHVGLIFSGCCHTMTMVLSHCTLTGSNKVNSDSSIQHVLYKLSSFQTKFSLEVVTPLEIQGKEFRIWRDSVKLAWTYRMKKQRE